MSSFTQADREYRRAIEAPGRELASAWASAREVQPDLRDNDITRAVLLRLKSFSVSQNLVKGAVDKKYAAPASDFFVETVAFYMRVVLEHLSPELKVSSERTIVRGRRSMRPDISIWSGADLIAAVECKTQLGWNRKGWREDFECREGRLKEEFPEARLFLLVMTGKNWSGCNDDHRAGKQFFVLLQDMWPGDLQETHAIKGDRIELLIHAIKALTRAAS